MKKFLPIVLLLVAIVGGYFLLVMNYSNGALDVSQRVKESWGNVSTAYQRRNDLIKNLVSTVKGVADFEKSTLESVINARAKATSVNIDPANVTPEQLKEFEQAQAGVSSSLGRLLVTVEQYPNLKANENFLKLQDELTSTENQILTARTRYNAAVGQYNGYILRFPNRLFLSGYVEKPYFEADKGAEKAPEINFDFK